MRFKDPLFLLLMLVWIPMIWVYIRGLRSGSAAIKFSGIASLKKIKSSIWIKLRHGLFVFRCIAIGLCAIALARPQTGLTEEEVLTEGVDIIMLLDISYSMKALDFKPNNRLFVAKQTMVDFVGKRVSDRIGLVVFAKRAFTKCPLTLDYDVVREFLADIDFDEYGDGTAIGTAIATAANRLKDSPAKSKIIILTTDGASNFGEISPITAAGASAQLGIKIYTIGVGRKGEVPYPMDYIDRNTGKVVETRIQMMPSDLDEQSLTDIAATTGGKFFRATNAEKLKEIYDEINTLEKTEIKTKSYTTWADHFYPWLLLGAMILMVEFVLTQTRFKKLP